MGMNILALIKFACLEKLTDGQDSRQQNNHHKQFYIKTLLQYSIETATAKETFQRFCWFEQYNIAHLIEVIE